MKSNRKCFHSKNCLLLKIKLCNFSVKMSKRKCKFTDEMKAEHPCFRKGRNEWKAECLVYNQGTDVYFLSLPCSLLCNNSVLFFVFINFAVFRNDWHCA